MKTTIARLSLVAILFVLITVTAKAQALSEASISKIKSEITHVFEKSIKAGEDLDVNAIEANINDKLQAGFIDNGNYFAHFADVMVGFKSAIQGLDSQTMNVTQKKITVLSEQHALLTTHGTFSAQVADGRVLRGKFAWSFVYAKIAGQWKVIHSHMSNPQ